MALLDIRHDIRFERSSFQPFLPHVDLALHDLSRDLVCDDSPSGAVTLYWHLPHGPRDGYQHDCFRLRSRMGALGYLPGKCGTLVLTCRPRLLTVLGLGFVVGGRCGFCLYLLLSPFCDVSTSAERLSQFSHSPPERCSRLISSTTVCISTNRSSPQ